MKRGKCRNVYISCCEVRKKIVLLFWDSYFSPQVNQIIWLKIVKTKMRTTQQPWAPLVAEWICLCELQETTSHCAGCCMDRHNEGSLWTALWGMLWWSTQCEVCVQFSVKEPKALKCLTDPQSDVRGSLEVHEGLGGFDFLLFL